MFILPVSDIVVKNFLITQVVSDRSTVVWLKGEEDPCVDLVYWIRENVSLHQYVDKICLLTSVLSIRTEGPDYVCFRRVWDPEGEKTVNGQLIVTDPIVTFRPTHCCLNGR